MRFVGGMLMALVVVAFMADPMSAKTVNAVCSYEVVYWRDAVAYTNEVGSELDLNKDLTNASQAQGCVRVVKKYKEVEVIYNFENQEADDFTVIPTGWVLSMVPYREEGRSQETFVLSGKQSVPRAARGGRPIRVVRKRNGGSVVHFHFEIAGKSEK